MRRPEYAQLLTGRYFVKENFLLIVRILGQNEEWTQFQRCRLVRIAGF
jgi:hypothetical protein